MKAIMAVPIPTPIFRFIHVDNLHIYLRRAGMHAPNSWPDDGLVWKTNHDERMQEKRRRERVPCGPGGTLHDYVGFYFGYLSPMMLRLKTGRVEGYDEGQEPLIYLVSTCQAIEESGADFVFYDGHALATFSDPSDDLRHLDRLEWDVVYLRYWYSTVDDMDREQRKQAEFLVWRFCPWSVVQEIVVIDQTRKAQVEQILAKYPVELNRVVTVRRSWYYH